MVGGVRVRSECRWALRVVAMQLPRACGPLGWTLVWKIHRENRLSRPQSCEALAAHVHRERRDMRREAQVVKCTRVLCTMSMEYSMDGARWSAIRGRLLCGQPLIQYST